MFERYIHRKGKKLGPYYYENVRTSDGKVRTVYVGTNPRQHTKHRVRKPLFFLILVLALILILGSLLFFLQNRDYLVKKASFEVYDFDIDQILLKVLVKSNEFVEKQLRIMNTGNSQSSISIEAAELSDIVKIDSSSFTLKPGNTKIVTLNFSSFIPEQKIEQQPAIYVGKLIVRSEKAIREIPVVIEIETKNVLFDMNLNPVALERKVKQGTETSIEVRLFNLKSIDSENVDIEYFVKDINGNTIQTESETVVVKTQASFFKTISAPRNLKPGPYVFAAQAKFGNSIGTASYLFEVTSPEEQGFLQFCRNSILCLGLSLTTILLMFALMAYFYFFVGAYLYEKFVGVALPRKRKYEEKIRYEKEDVEAVEEPKEGAFERIFNKIGRWKEDRKRKNAEKEKLERESALQSLKEERRRLEAKRREVEEERRNEEVRKEEELRKQKEAERIQKEEELNKKALERKKLKKHLKKRIKELLHKIGLYRTPEEKKQKEAEKQHALEEKRILEEERKQQLAKHEHGKKAKRSHNLNKFYNILNELRNALNRKDISELNRLHNKARNMYVSLLDEEKREIYDKLLALHKQISQLVKEKKLEELSEQRKLEAKLEDERKRLEEEKRQILLQKEKEKQEQQAAHALDGFYRAFDELKDALNNNDLLKAKRLYIEARNIYSVLPIGEKHEAYHKLLALHRHIGRLAEEKIQRQKELEKQKAGEERKRKQEELTEQREIAERTKEIERQKKRLEKEKRAGERKEKLMEFFHKIGLYKTPEEKRQILLQKEKEKRERLRKELESRQQKEAEKQKEEQRRKELDQERRKLEELKEQWNASKPGDKQAGELNASPLDERERAKHSRAQLSRMQAEIPHVPQTRPQLTEKKPTIFGRLLKVKEQITEKKTEEKPKGQKAPQTEFEELEEAIRNLGLFKEIEKERTAVKEPKEKLTLFGKLFRK